MTKVGIVAEGTNDFPALEWFVRQELPKEFERPLSFEYLQPAPDATTGKMSGGGWGRVVGWCNTHSGNALRTYFHPLFLGDVACDCILIQIDGDAVDACGAHSTVPVPSDAANIPDRLAALSQMTVAWLLPPDDLKTKIALAFPFLHTEAWLMAAVQPHAQQWEAVNSKPEFRKLKKPGTRKMRDFYDGIAQEAAAKGDLIAEQCESFRAFRASLRCLAAQKP